MQRSFAPSTSSAYLFLMGALLFGLPLLTAYYNVNASFYFPALISYLVITISVAVFLILLSLRRGNISPSLPSALNNGKIWKSGFMGGFNSIPIYFIMGLFTLTVVLFGLMRYLVDSYYPYPPPRFTDYVGGGYIVLLAVVTILGISRLLYSSFPVLRRILQEKKYGSLAAFVSAGFAFVYLILVNQVLINGYNTIGNVTPPGNVYPFIHVFTVGIQQPFLNLFYLPYVIVQISPQLDLLIIPFEMIFVVILSLLVASNVVMAHYLISNSGLSCSTRGTVLSTGGSIIGLTATCPTCLAPTFVSVIFGGVVAAESIYSNLYGVILPPVISLVTLVFSVVYLSRMIKKRTYINAESGP
ncbi:MAG: hypothetical protein ACYC7D_10925 [Nitrososphaerales archaeon]